MSFVLYISLFIICSSVSAFRIIVQNEPVAGGQILCRWEKDRQDPDDFAIRLRRLPGNSNGPFTPVRSRSDDGTVRITVQEAGDYMLEIYTLGSSSPRGSSNTFTVRAAPTSPPIDPTPPPPLSTSTRASTPTQAPPSTDTSPNGPTEGTTQNTSRTSAQAPTTQPSNDNQGGSGADSGSTSRGTSGILTISGADRDGPITLMPATTPQVITFISGSLIMTQTIPPISPTSSETPGGGSGASTRKPDVGAIIGAVVAIALALLLLFALLAYRRRRRRQATSTFFRDKMVRSSENASGIYDANPSSTVLHVATHVPDAGPGQKNEDADQAMVHQGATEHQHARQLSNYSSVMESPTSTISYYNGLFTQPTKSQRVTPIRESIIEPSSVTSALGLARPRTDRQMELHEKIVALQSQLVSVPQLWIKRTSTGSSAGMSEAEKLLRDRVQVLEGLMNSPWALNHTDVVPSEYLDTASDSVR